MRYKRLITRFDGQIMYLFITGKQGRKQIEQDLGLAHQTVVQAFCRVRKTVNKTLGCKNVKNDIELYFFLERYGSILFSAQYDSQAPDGSDLILFLNYLPPQLDQVFVKYYPKLNKWGLNWRKYKDSSY